jgi:outer membrane receptor for ferrienterochelin and colicin
VRYDFYRNHDAKFTPRIHLRYEITPQITLRASAGKGYRTVHVRAENLYYLASSRSIIIADDLVIEEAWNAGINLTGYIPLAGRELRLTGEAYRTTFLRQIVTDLDSSVDQVLFYNLDGPSWSNVIRASTFGNTGVSNSALIPRIFHSPVKRTQHPFLAKSA